MTEKQWRKRFHQRVREYREGNRAISLYGTGTPSNLTQFLRNQESLITAMPTTTSNIHLCAELEAKRQAHADKMRSPEGRQRSLAFREGRLAAYVEQARKQQLPDPAVAPPPSEWPEVGPVRPPKDLVGAMQTVWEESPEQARAFGYAAYKHADASLNWREFAEERATNCGLTDGDLTPNVVAYLEMLSQELEHYALRAVFAETREREKAATIDALSQQIAEERYQAASKSRMERDNWKQQHDVSFKEALDASYKRSNATEHAAQVESARTFADPFDSTMGYDEDDEVGQDGAFLPHSSDENDDKLDDGALADAAAKMRPAAATVPAPLLVCTQYRETQWVGKCDPDALPLVECYEVVVVAANEEVKCQVYARNLLDAATYAATLGATDPATGRPTDKTYCLWPCPEEAEGRAVALEVRQDPVRARPLPLDTVLIFVTTLET